MKKFLTLALTFVFALCLAAPALAYTTNVAPQQGVSPYTVEVYLVEYKNVDIFSGWIGMPASDRGYATNEIIAFVGALTVPAKRNVVQDWYREIRFSGNNVALDVMDNFGDTTAYRYWWLRNTVPEMETANNPGLFYSDSIWTDKPQNTWKMNEDNNTLSHPLIATGADGTTYRDYGPNIPVNNNEAKTYRWLCFGKVTGDDATVTFSLSRNAMFRNVATFSAEPAWMDDATNEATTNFPRTDALERNTMQYLVINEDYVVIRTNNLNTNNMYYVFDNPMGYAFGLEDDPNTILATALGDLKFAIQTEGSWGKTTRMYLYPTGGAGVEYRIFVEPTKQELYIQYGANKPVTIASGDQVNFGTSLYSSVFRFYEEVVVNDFGFSAYNEGNMMTADDWEAIASAAWDITDTVDVEPWTPYVAVPGNIVTDPPKTGDASFLGFVLIALAAAAAVVVRKVRA